MLTSEQFLKSLRGALNHLYDPDHLRRSPLAALFGVADRLDTPSSLRRILTEAIESLKPGSDERPQSATWRTYELLFYRYVQQFSQKEVADQLGVSVRHLRRLQHAALEALAGRLWEQFHLKEKLREDSDAEAATVQAAMTGSTLKEELAWLKDATPGSSTDLNQTLPAVLDLVRPLAAQYGVRLECKLADNVPNLAVHPVALRQILLDLLSLAIRWPSCGRVRVSAKSLRWEVEIRVGCTKFTSARKPPWDEEAARPDMAHWLADLCGGRLTLSADEGAFSATLTLPALEQLPVLAIDDNADTLQLLQRYTSGTRYRLVGTRDPEQALSLAEKLSPQIIVLDVMMPQVDGWEMLGRLRQHPLTGHIPIVVFTILAQEELALSLGASTFIHKPVTRQAFLAALDHQIKRMEPEPR